MRAALRAVLDAAPKSAGQSNQIFMTPRAEFALSRAKAEADRLGDRYISAEHLLIALTREDQGPVAAILRQRGINTEGVYQVSSDGTRQPRALPTSAPRANTAPSTASAWI